MMMTAESSHRSALAELPRRALHPRSLSASAAWFGVTAVGLGILAPILLISATPLGSGSSSAWVWAWVLTVVAGVRYAWLVATAPYRLYELIFWLFTDVFLGFAPLVQMRSGRYPATTKFIDTSLNGEAMLVVGIGVAAFCIGLSIVGNRHATRHSAPKKFALTPGGLILLTTLALLVTAYYTSKVGVSTMFASRDTRSLTESRVWSNATNNAVIKAAATWPLVICFTGLMRLRAERSKAGLKGPVFLHWLVLVVLVVVVNPISSPRYVAGTAALAVLVALGAARTQKRARIFAVILAIGMVFVFPYAAFARTSTQTPSAQRGGTAQVLASSDFDAFDQIDNTLSYVHANGVSDGQQLIGAAFFWVPRAVWPGKPEDTGILLAQFRGYKFKNLSEPLWGEFFIDGGWILLAGGMMMLGAALRRFDGRSSDWIANHNRSILGTILPFYLVIILRGSLLAAMAGLAVVVVSAVVVNRARWPARGLR